MSPKGLSLRVLWSMAAGRREQHRQHVIEACGVEGRGGKRTDWLEFVRSGAIDDPIVERVEPNLELVKKVHENIARNNGRLIFEEM